MTLPRLLAVLVLTLPLSRADDLSSWVSQLESQRDDADPQLIQNIADLGTREAAEALIDVYDSFGSVYLKREVVRALGRFAEVEDAFQLALERVANEAAGAPDRELREAAVDVLGDCGSRAKPFLAQIVNAPAADSIREQAFARFAALADESDHEWFHSLWYVDKRQAKEEQKREREARKRAKKKGEGEELELKVHRLESLRGAAFGAMVEALDERDLTAATEDPNHEIRRAALAELGRRESTRAPKLAERLFERNDGEEESTRILAAELIVNDRGKKAARDLLDVAQKFVTPTRLRWSLAALLNELRDKTTDRKIVKLLDSDDDWLAVFALRATRSLEDEKVDEALRASLASEDESVRMLAAEILAEREDPEAASLIEARFEASPGEIESAHLLSILSGLHAGDPAWREKQLSLLGRPEARVRNAVLADVAEHPDPALLDELVLLLDHPDWSTRLAAVRALEALRIPGVVGPLIERLGAENGRPAKEISRALWRLTGQPYGTRQGNWQAWWKDAEAGFEPVSPEELERLAAEEEARRLKQISKSDAQFFGLRLETERVLFIIDVSGSMGETLRTDHYGERAETRIDAAKRELAQCIQNLAEGAFFNIIAFSGGVTRYLDDGAASASTKSREDALEYVELLGAMGGTNLYGALEAGFEDPDVDTIVLLSDGEPSTGEVIDPHLIRAEVAAWNEHRGVVIHSVSVGTPLQILEWLAEDSGGSHVRIE